MSPSAVQVVTLKPEAAPTPAPAAAAVTKEPAAPKSCMHYIYSRTCTHTHTHTPMFVTVTKETAPKPCMHYVSSHTCTHITLCCFIVYFRRVMRLAPRTNMFPICFHSGLNRLRAGSGTRLRFVPAVANKPDGASKDLSRLELQGIRAQLKQIEQEVCFNPHTHTRTYAYKCTFKK